MEGLPSLWLLFSSSIYVIQYLANCCCLFFSPPYKYMFLSGSVYNLCFFYRCTSILLMWKLKLQMKTLMQTMQAQQRSITRIYKKLAVFYKLIWKWQTLLMYGDSNTNNNEFSVFGPRSYDCFLSSSKRKTLKIQAFFSLLLKKRSWL